MKRLYILITNNISFDQRMHKIAETLSSDFDVCIIGSSTRRPPPLEQRCYKQQRIKTVFKAGKGFYIEYNFRLICTLFWRKPDVIYSVDLDTLLPATILSKARNLPLIYDAHEYFTEVPELQGRTFVQNIWRKIERYGIKQASICITVGTELSKIYGSLYLKTFHTVRNVPILQDAQNVDKPRSERKTILYQGAVNEGRGVEASIRAMQHLPHMQLIIAGGGPSLEACKNLTEKLELENIVFTGMLPPSQLKQYTKKAWLGLNLLEGESLNYYYSLANKFFDYTASLVPSVNMNFPEYSTLMSHHKVGLLIEPADISQLHKFILSLEQDEERYFSMKKACQQATKDWNWSTEAVQLNRLVDRLR